MKKIVDGVSYNTSTATKIAWQDNDYLDDDNQPVEGRLDLMVTPRGAYFMLEIGKQRRWNGGIQEHEWRDFSILSPLSPDDARQRIAKGEWTIIDESFAEFPEAEAAPEAENVGDKPAALYVRMPASLKRRIDAAAGNAGVSTNAFVMRCAERCLKALSSDKELERLIGNVPVTRDEQAGRKNLLTPYTLDDGKSLLKGYTDDT